MQNFDITNAKQPTAKDIIGVWHLEDFIVHRANGRMFNWPGKQNGTLIYTETGYVSVAQNRDPLPNPSIADKARVSNFYTAKWEIVDDALYHTVLQSSVKSIIGLRKKRDALLLADGSLLLSGKGLDETVTLRWVKCEK